MKPNTLIFYLIITALCACRQHAQLDTQAELYMRYDLQARKLSAEATFFDLVEGKKTSSKVFQGGVAFINSGMQTSTLPGGIVRYSYELYGNLPARNYFAWHQEGDEEVRAETPLGSIAEVNIDNEQISRSKGFRFHFAGEPLGPGEKLVMLLVDADRKAINLDISGPSDGTTFEVAPGKFAGLATGPAQVELVRTRTDTTEKQGTKIFLTSEYYAMPVATAIVD